MICKNCGRTHSDYERFCGTCGAPLTNESSVQNYASKDNWKKTLLIILVVVLALAVVVMGVLLISKDSEKDSGKDSEKKTTSGGSTILGGVGEETSEKYYPGTDILSFTGVTGIPMIDDDSYVDDETGQVTNAYLVESVDDVNGYIEVLENDGYYISELKKLSASFSVIVCRKDKNQVGIGFEHIDDKTFSDEIYITYQTNAGDADCLSCSSYGYDRCQGHNCDICSGRGSLTCSGCNGTGMARVPSSYSNKCVVCYGGGTQICPNCDGAGKTFID